MLLKDDLKKVVKYQIEELDKIELGIKREIIKNIGIDTKQAIILSGIRRCGKSTLLRQIMKSFDKFYYFNFDDSRAFGFDVSDFERLKEAFEEELGSSKTWFFDEIQNVHEWERFVRTLRDLEHKFFITGSNASLLSKELGTRLTGRHITYELFPFSYKEMLEFNKYKPSLKSLEEYLENGGFPEFLREKKIEFLHELLNDIIARDIVTRYSIKNSNLVKSLAIYCLTNIGKEFSYNKIAKYFNMSPHTVIDYISFFENSYMIFTVPKFDFSYKKQVIANKKIYAIDTGFIRANSASFSEDRGRVLENIIFMELRRRHKDIFYYKKEKECDFIVKDREKPILAVQVCLKLTQENMKRELEGLKEAMNDLKIKNAVIITLDQEDKIDGIQVKPVWKWLIDKM